MRSAFFPLSSVWIASCCLMSLGVARPAGAQGAPPVVAETGTPTPDAPVADLAQPATPPSSLPSPAEAPPDPASPPAASGELASPPATATPPTTGSAAFAPLPETPLRREVHPAPAVAPTTAFVTQPAPQPPPPAASVGAGSAAPSSLDYDPSGDDPSGPLGPFRLGVLVGGGLPELLSFGAQLKITRYVGVGVNVGLIPTVKISYYGDATVSYQEYDLYGRIYPFGGAFFLGAGVGYATVRGTLATDYTAPANVLAIAQMYDRNYRNPLNIEANGSVRTMVLTPQLGFLHVFGAGFAVGLDVGAQVPIAPSRVDTSTTLTPTLPAQIQSVIQTQYIDPNEAKVRSTLNKVGRTPLPTVGFRLGWFL